MTNEYLQPGDKVRLIANPGRIGILGNETDGPPHRLRMLVTFLDGDEQFVLAGSLEKVRKEVTGPYAMLRGGSYGRVRDLRGTVTYYRLSGRLANLIYSLNTTNTLFLPYQFKPVLQFLDTPSNGILIADEVGLGKTIEAGLIWTELRARADAKRLLVVCPAMLQEKWKNELANRFGVNAEIVSAGGLREKLEALRERPGQQFALVASMQGLRPSRGWNDEEEPAQTESAKLARFLDEVEFEDALFDLVVVDEAHYLRNRDTQTHRLARLLRPLAQNLVLLSATPIQLRSTDLFNLLHLLDENAFPYEHSFQLALMANAPIVSLRDKVLNGKVDQETFIGSLKEAHAYDFLEESTQIAHLLENPPSEAKLASFAGRAEVADVLDSINPLAKVVTRTLKRDVQEMRVERQPAIISVDMTAREREFYDAVTAAVRKFCERMEMSEGFLLTIPQRQMSSCIAAACRGWIDRTAGDEEELDSAVYEMFGDSEDRISRPGIGGLIHTLVGIARRIGDPETLEAEDTKYAKLISNLKPYWKEYPGKKIVLFSFYRNTLYYLRRRLQAEGIRSVVLHGGMDKLEALRQFESAGGPDILLSSEVASEGVDLQFSSLLINYDLPWNPAKIEQRIGRIDRIGQEEPKILIWNFVHADTVDARIYERLLERLDIFRFALGSMEAMLGEEIRTLGYELLSHQLTPEQEDKRIDRAKVAIETARRQQEQLEEEATHLIAHGDFIQNKVRAANELGRYVRGQDLLAYVRDYLEREYAGTRLIATDDDPLALVLELSTDGRLAFSDFLQAERLQGGTCILSANPPTLLFENRLGKNSATVERVTQDHPLVRFVAGRLRQTGCTQLYSPVSAVEISALRLNGARPGTYVYAIARWTISGSRDIERLEYLMRSVGDGAWVEGALAEHWVNTASLEGRDWLSARNESDHDLVAARFEDCRFELDERFRAFRDSQIRENQDRINMMLRALEHHTVTQSNRISERIARYRYTGTDKQRRMIPAEEGKLRTLRKKMGDRMDELRAKASPQALASFVCAGVIRVTK
jgi:superfamily II DNA or RNA helicase